MTMRPDITDLRALFLSGAPLMDVRAPIEFEKGSFPGAINLPLINDDERAAVGAAYTQEGQDAAVALGHQLVSGDVKASRVQAWQDFAKANPDGYLFCFRGGMRSQITQGWLADAGMPYPLVKGGYKAMRRFLLDEIDHLSTALDGVLVSGRTGTGKTILLHQLKKQGSSIIDLEGLADHKGSSFGRPIDDIQPTQIAFENALGVEMVKASGTRAPVFVEDESQRIGQRHIPPSLMDAIGHWPVVIVDEGMDTRVQTIFDDYITGKFEQFQKRHEDQEQAFDAFSDYLRQSFHRIRKRLGGLRFQQLSQVLDDALIHHKAGEDSRHKVWIEALLKDYYDPMYDYQMKKHERKPVFKGSKLDILAWAGEART